MKIRKRKKSESQIQVREGEKVHEIHCPRCNRFIKKIKKKKHTERLEFECSCTQRFSLVFPGIDESKENWLAGHGDEFTDFKLRRKG